MTVSFSASLPLWAKLAIGAALAALAIFSVNRAVRRLNPLPRWADPRSYSRRDVAVPAYLAAGFLIALVALSFDVVNSGLITRTLDGPIHDWFVGHRDVALTPMAVVITNLVSPFGSTVLAIVLATAVAWRTRLWIPALIIFIGPSVAGLAVRLVKLLAPRARPPLANQVVLTVEPSFPSGHVAGAVSLYGCLTMVVLIGFLGPISRRTRRLIIAAAILATLVVILTRLYLAVHWFTDVSAAVLLASVVVSATLAGYRQFARTRPAVS